MATPDAFNQRTRSYQLEMFERSLEGNRIIVMDTGSGKTQVAMLRIQAELARCPSEKRVWFLAPMVDLCEQQFNVLSAAMPAYKMRLLTGLDNVDKWSEQRIWDAALDQARVVVSTHAILADALKHAFITLDTLALLVFDEAHHCIKKHPANVIMRDFYHPMKARLGSEAVPHILGLSASLVMSSNLKSLRTIESNLDSLSVTPRLHRADLLQCVYRPDCRLVSYNAGNNRQSPGVTSLCNSILHYEAQSVARSTTGHEAESLHNALLLFRRKALHINEQLGAWAADYFVLETIQLLRAKATTMPQIEMDIKVATQRSLLQLFDDAGVEPACRSTNVNVPEHVSLKVMCLIDYLLEPREDRLRGIVFVRQRIVAVVLSILLNSHPATKTMFTSMPSTGASNASSRKSTITELIDLRVQQRTLGRFRTGEIDLVIATSVLEEGIDVPACNTVACFDPPTNLKSFIQTRGRARHKQSRLGILICNDDDRSIVQKFNALEEELTAICQSDRQHLEANRQGAEREEDMDYVLVASSTGARLDADAALSHLYHFCDQLSHRAFVDSRPAFTLEQDGSLIRALVTLPDTVPARVRRAKSKRAWQTDKAAEKDAAFQAYAALYDAGLLNENLLPLCHEWNVQQGVEPQDTLSGQIEISSQLDIWTSPAIEEYTVLECRLTTPSQFRDDNSEPMRLLLLMRGEVAIPPALLLHWDSSATFQIDLKLATPGSITLSTQHVNLLRDVTTAIFRASRSDRHWNIEGTPSTFLVPDMPIHELEDWYTAISEKLVGEDLFGQAGKWLVRAPYPGNPPYICKGWLETSEGRRVIGERLSRRRNFLLPPTAAEVFDEAKKPEDGSSRRQQQVLPLEGCTFSSMPVSWARVGLFMPVLFQHIHDYTTARMLMSTLLSIIPLSSHEHILTALCAPSAARVTHYQRHEFVGDSILKFVASCALFNANPDWPEGYLSQRRSLLVCNSTLAKAALTLSLDQYVITDPIDYRNWSLPVNNGLSSSKRRVSSKVLADVLEALIGAVWLDAGLSAALQSINLFIPAMPVNRAFEIQALAGTQTFAKQGELEALIGYTFNNTSLLVEALTHPSYGRYNKGNSYERLEFLGDAVLDMIVTQELTTRLEQLSQGQMTQIKAALVNARLLGFLCMGLRHRERHRTVNTTSSRDTIETTYIHETSLASYLYFQSEGIATLHQACELRYHEYHEDISSILNTGTRFPWVELSSLSIDKVYSDMVESMLGAIFLDSNQDLSACNSFIERLGFQAYMRRTMDLVDVTHPRNKLQQLAGAKKCSTTTSRSQHGSGYACSVVIEDKTVATVDDCLDAEEAEVRAADKAVQLLSPGRDIRQ